MSPLRLPSGRRAVVLVLAVGVAAASGQHVLGTRIDHGPVPAGVGVGLLVGVVALALAALAETVRAAEVQPSVAATAAVAPDPAPPAPGRTDADRGRLVDLLTALVDVVDRPGLHERIVRTLGDVGVEPVPADGAAFDPAVHEAVGVEPSPPGGHGTVARTTRSGWTDHGRVLRPAEVLVYSDDAGSVS